MTDALSGESCITISAAKPILNHIINEEDGDTDMTKEIKERVKVDLELRYLGDEIGQLLELTSFLDPQFKLTQVNGRAGILKEIEMQMVEEMDTDVTAISAESITGRPNSSSSEGIPPPNKVLVRYLVVVLLI